MTGTYDRAWRKLRLAWASRLAAGELAICPRCGKPVSASQAWDLGHTTDAVAGGTAAGARPEHRRCNRRAGAETAQARRARARVVQLDPVFLTRAESPTRPRVAPPPRVGQKTPGVPW